MQNERSVWPDIARGIAILLVVIFHTGSGVLKSINQEPTYLWTLLTDLSYAFMVPVFFFFSGWFAQISRKPMAKRIESLFSNLLYPYLIWSIIQTMIMITVKAGNTEVLWSDLPAILLNGSMQFWFLHSLMIIMGLDLLFRKIKLGSEIRLGLAILAISMAALGVKFPWELGNVASHFIYFELGVFIIGNADAKASVSLKKLWLMFLGGSLLLVTFHFEEANYYTDLRPLAALAGIAASIGLSVIISVKPNRIASMFAYCGRYSLQIYVLHVIFAAGTRVVLIKVGIDQFWLHMVLGTLVGTVGPLIVGLVDERYLKALFRFPSFLRKSKPVMERVS